MIMLTPVELCWRGESLVDDTLSLNHLTTQNERRLVLVGGTDS